MSFALVAVATALLNSAPTEDLPRSIGSWDPKLVGNHRIVIRVAANSAAVRVHIPWRRRDKHPETIDTEITDAAGNLIKNVFRKEIRRDFCDLAFQPVAGPGTYYLYHLPHITHGSYYPSVEYIRPSETADSSWRKSVTGTDWDALPLATAERFESVSALDAFTPMEVIASPDEVSGLLNQNPDRPFLVFPEDRHLSIRMPDDIPYRWAMRGANTPFAGTANRGEYYAFQLGVWAARMSLQTVNVRFTALRLKSGSNATIPKDALTCYNTTGIDYKGNPFQIDLSVPKLKIQPLWCGIDVPQNARPGDYVGDAFVSAHGNSEVRIPISLTVRPQLAIDHGDDDPSDMTRIRWLNSRLGQGSQVVKPFRSDGPLGAMVELGANGFFKQVTKMRLYPAAMMKSDQVNLFAQPMRFEVDGQTGKLPETVVETPHEKRRDGAESVWGQESRIGAIRKHLQGQMQFDGSVDITAELEATADSNLKDIHLDLPLNPKVAQYFMGMGREGGLAPESLDWKWSVQNNQEGAWIGNPECGLSFALRDEHYERPLNTNFYHEKPLIMPKSWDNHGLGGVRIRSLNGEYLITCYTGRREMKAGEKLQFRLHMIVTPSKPIDPHRQFTERYFHAYQPLSTIQAEGANVVNIHHATEINPWINYPFLGLNPTPDGHQGPASKMRAYIADAHGKGMRVKIYDTIRELSNRTPELFMLKSLGHEIFSSGKGGGGSWLREHLDDDYISAWHATEVGDAAIVDSGTSRWHNYYVEGLNWLAKNVGIDGLYLDDVAFDRTTMIRVRRVLENRISQRPPPVPNGLPNRPIIDLHSANQHDENDGWNNSALLYLDLMPYLDRLWFGEEFNYNKLPDYWLVELSGIPFGLMGEMLQDGGNPWRGMLFGMTARRPWSGDPRPIWKVWDQFGITDAEMMGWWTNNCPVKTDQKNVLATVYLRPARDHHPATALVAIASWAKDPTVVNLKIDWKALGIDPSTAVLVANSIDKFQTGRRFDPGEPIPVPPGQGWLLVIESKR